LNWDCSIIEHFLKIYLRPIRRFYGAYLLSKSANASLKSSIYLEGWFWESVLFKLLNNDKEKCNKKFCSKLINCLGTGGDKNKILSSKISNLVILFSFWCVMFQCSKPFSVDFLEFLVKRRHLKHLKKSANKFIKNKKIMRNMFLNISSV